jgi:hypothetical protein
MSAEQVPVTTAYLKTSLMLIDNERGTVDANTTKFTPENIKTALKKLGLNHWFSGEYHSDEATLYTPKPQTDGSEKRDIDLLYEEIIKYDEVPVSTEAPVSTGGKRKSRKNRRSRKMKVRKSKSQRRRR